MRTETTLSVLDLRNSLDSQNSQSHSAKEVPFRKQFVRMVTIL
jgi:hypothetical protein